MSFLPKSSVGSPSTAPQESASPAWPSVSGRFSTVGGNAAPRPWLPSAGVPSLRSRSSNLSRLLMPRRLLQHQSSSTANQAPSITSQASVAVSQPQGVTSQSYVLTSQSSVLTSRSSVLTSQSFDMTNQLARITSQSSMVISTAPSQINAHTQEAVVSNAAGVSVADISSTTTLSEQSSAADDGRS